MSSRALIDQQFDRAVEIVQGLPKTGPIQTQYDEKLTMYALYKQATVGNVQGPRPGMWDMLGRAKWDAWAKNKDLDPLEAKWLYVDALLRVLRKYSDKTTAKSLVQELESFGGDPGNLVMTSSFSKSHHSRSSASTEPAERNPISSPTGPEESSEEEETDDDDDDDEEEGQGMASSLHRPPSSMSSNRYRTPMAGSLAMSPPPPSVPSSQPLPTFSTPSAFAEYLPPPSSYQVPSSISIGPSSEYRAVHPSEYQTQPAPPSHGSYGPTIRRPASRMTLEHAVENVQVHLAALTERMDSIQSSFPYPLSSRISHGSRILRASGDHHPISIYDLDDMGLWSYVAHPVARGIDMLREAATILATNENRTPTMSIIRRLCLDVSFLFCVIGAIRILWRKSGVRRREVKAALGMLWKAVIGSRERTLIDRGV